VKLAVREPARSDDREFRTWGAVVRDLTARVTRDERLPDTQGVWLENVRPAGPAARPSRCCAAATCLIAVDGKPIGSVAELQDLTRQLMVDAPKGVRTVLASVRRDGAC
jgi:S1-C subfamily serine protease